MQNSVTVTKNNNTSQQNTSNPSPTASLGDYLSRPSGICPMNARIIQHEKYQSMQYTTMIEQKGEKHSSSNGEKAFNPFISKLLRKLGIKRNFLSTVKDTFGTPQQT